MIRSILLLGTLVAGLATTTEAAYAYAKTSSGTVKGNQLQHANEFLGMPYATAARFTAPTDWQQPYNTTPFDATYFGQACLQYFSPLETYGIEDCFVINVWQPRNWTEGQELLPVLYYIYGGSWDFDEAEPYNSSELAGLHNAVVVSINYRVGPLSFSVFQSELDKGISSGNYGIQDMHSGLRWVQREIANFGGDKNRVAIFGQSSGAEGVELLTVLPASKGLFRGAISQSGGIGARTLADGLKVTQALSKKLGCVNSTKYSSEYECMQHAPAQLLIKLQNQGDEGPIIDGILIPEDPVVLLTSGKVLDVDILWGSNTNDSNLEIQGMFHGQNLTAADYVKFVTASVPKGTPQSTIDEILAAYPPNPTPGFNQVNTIGWLESDRMLCDNHRIVRAVASTPGRKSKSFIYRYNYFFQSNKTCTAVSNYHDPSLGSIHQDEVSFVFGQPIFMDLGYTNCSTPGWSGYDPTCLGCVYNELEAQFAFEMGSFWTNLAASGDPNLRNPSDKPVPGMEWTPFTVESDANIVLYPRSDPNVFFEVEKGMGRAANCAMWDKIDGF